MLHLVATRARLPLPCTFLWLFPVIDKGIIKRSSQSLRTTHAEGLQGDGISTKDTFWGAIVVKTEQSGIGYLSPLVRADNEVDVDISVFLKKCAIATRFWRQRAILRWQFIRTRISSVMTGVKTVHYGLTINIQAALGWWWKLLTFQLGFFSCRPAGPRAAALGGW
jgi:hypothetical protein